MKTFENHFTTSAIYTERFKFTQSFVHRLGFTFSLTKAFALKTQLHWPNFVQEHLWCFELQFSLMRQQTLTYAKFVSFPSFHIVTSDQISLSQTLDHRFSVFFLFIFKIRRLSRLQSQTPKNNEIFSLLHHKLESLARKIAASNLFLFSFLPFMFSYNPPLHKLIFAMQLKGLWHLSKTHWKLFDKSLRICNAFKVRLDHVKIFFFTGVLIIE